MRETQHIEFKSSFDDKVIETLSAFANTKGGKVARNKLIAEAFYLTGDIEKYGSGFLRIRDAISSYPTMKIDFKEIGGGFMVTIAYTKQKISTDIENKDTITPQATPQATPQVTPQVMELLKILDREMNRAEIQEILKLSDRENFRRNYIQPALKLEFIELVYPDNPSHPKQKYRLTKKAMELLKGKT